ncbi:MAG: hypothetical protein ABI995_08975 [Acidobacteriota bacterium]
MDSLVFRERFARAFLLKLHMTWLVAFTALAGVGASAILLHYGVTDLRIRYPLAVGVSYAAFLGAVRIWWSYIGRRLDQLDALPDIAPRPALFAAESQRRDGGGLELLDLVIPDPFEIFSALALVMCGFVLLVGGVGGFFVYLAEPILAEIAVDALAATCLAQAYRQGWLVQTARSTRVWFAGILCASLGLALTVHHYHPEAARLADVFRL